MITNKCTLFHSVSHFSETEGKNEPQKLSKTSSQYESLMAVTCNYTVKFNRDALNKCGSACDFVEGSCCNYTSSLNIRIGFFSRFMYNSFFLLLKRWKINNLFVVWTIRGFSKSKILKVFLQCATKRT